MSKKEKRAGGIFFFFSSCCVYEKKTFVISSLKTKIQLIADHFFIGRETEVGIEFDDHSSLFLASFFTKHVRFFFFFADEPGLLGIRRFKADEAFVFG